MNSEILIGPMMRGLPAQETNILHLLKGLFNGGEGTVCLYDVGRGLHRMIGDENGFSKAMRRFNKWCILREQYRLK